MSTAGWRMAQALTGGEEHRFTAMAAMLAREFRRFDFGVQEVHGHVAISAVRRAGPGVPGLYAMVTDDVGELRQALTEDRDSP